MTSLPRSTWRLTNLTNRNKHFDLIYVRGEVCNRDHSKQTILDISLIYARNAIALGEGIQRIINIFDKGIQWERFSYDLCYQEWK